MANDTAPKFTIVISDIISRLEGVKTIEQFRDGFKKRFELRLDYPDRLLLNQHGGFRDEVFLRGIFHSAAERFQLDAC